MKAIIYSVIFWCSLLTQSAWAAASCFNENVQCKVRCATNSERSVSACERACDKKIDLDECYEKLIKRESDGGKSKPNGSAPQGPNIKPARHASKKSLFAYLIDDPESHYRGQISQAGIAIAVAGSEVEAKDLIEIYNDRRFPLVNYYRLDSGYCGRGWFGLGVNRWFGDKAGISSVVLVCNKGSLEAAQDEALKSQPHQIFHWVFGVVEDVSTRDPEKLACELTSDPDTGILMYPGWTPQAWMGYLKRYNSAFPDEEAKQKCARLGPALVDREPQYHLRVLPKSR